jgi:TetR/AcrR family transcriptional regulator, transcriptional repressor for nem operon
MKVSKEKAAENRELILTQAARLFRERGVLGVGVDALTEAAGLTHGSLYSRFGSKDNLLAESLKHGHAASQSRATGVKSLADAVAAYLSPAHRDNPGSGCFMAALGCDMPRQSKRVRASFTQIVRNNFTRLAGLLPAGRQRKREDTILSTMATMVGAMILARAVDDQALSDRILSAARTQLIQQK